MSNQEPRPWMGAPCARPDCTIDGWHAHEDDDPTPNQLVLLDAAARRPSQIIQLRDGELRRYYGDGTYTTIMPALVEELHAKGWIAMGRPLGHGCHDWRLTEVGKLVLANATAEPTVVVDK